MSPCGLGKFELPEIKQGRKKVKRLKSFEECLLERSESKIHVTV